MQIDINDLRQLFQSEPTKETAMIPKGETWIVIADRGFVWVGKVYDRGNCLQIDNCRNVRIWGTKKGLGELRDGPTESTKTDECGTVVVPMKAVIGLIKCTREW